MKITHSWVLRLAVVRSIRGVTHKPKNFAIADCKHMAVCGGGGRYTMHGGGIRLDRCHIRECLGFVCVCLCVNVCV